jgi:2-polyprenyl-3-methyl-5-hydroxy-6-metoxy-1,4-benzoquinol methylase
MHASAPECRTCGSLNTASIGRLPDVGTFAGSRLAAPLNGGVLHACRACGFVFRAPVRSDAEYLALYAQGSVAVWEQNPDREDFRLVRGEVADAPLDVLDVGCYTGHLLATLPKACHLYGVEPNADAAAMAASRGVAIVAKHWDELEATDRVYDIIIACDVIEHFANPLTFLTTLSTRLRPAGKLIITTGNAQAWPWRLARSRFWYCYFPEHISFIGPRWLLRMSPSAGLHVKRLVSFSHSPLPALGSRAKALLATCLRMLASAVGPARSGPGGQEEVALLLGGGISKDHIFCVLGKG